MDNIYDCVLSARDMWSIQAVISVDYDRTVDVIINVAKHSWGYSISEKAVQYETVILSIYTCIRQTFMYNNSASI